MLEKLAPRLDGSYAKTNNAEAFSIVYEEQRMYLLYQTPYDSWKEEVIQASEDKLTLSNTEGTRYHYKPFTPININE